MPIDQIDGDDVAEALGEVWRANASAGRILNRVEQIFERAIARELRAPDNPARLTLQRHILGPAGEGGGLGHASLPWPQVPAFIARLRGEERLPQTGSPAAEVFQFPDGRHAMAFSRISSNGWA